MIGLNGSLVAVLCLAYFVLFAVALSYGQSPAEDAAGMAQRSTRSTRPGAETIVAYTRSARDHQARSHRTDQAIGAIVLSLRHGQRAS
jgi:hypothetical protein